MNNPERLNRLSLCFTADTIKDDLVIEMVSGDKRLLEYSRVTINPNAVAIPPTTVSTTQIVGGPIKSSLFI